MKKIYNGDINDLYSYITKILDVEKFKYIEEDILLDKEQHYLIQVERKKEVETKFRKKYGEDYDTMVENWKEMQKRMNQLIDYDGNKIKAKIDLHEDINKMDFKYEFNMGGKPLKYNLLEEYIYVINDNVRQKIMDLISV